MPRVDGEYDYEQLSRLLQQIKARFPDKLDATLLLESDTPYDTLVQVMDRVRVAQVVVAGSVESAELFPEIAIGDAPLTNVRMAGQ
jgi:pentose-5-phosphate-3-epimerase